MSNNVDKADLIITDPPYNTGGKDFVYNDRYGTDAWLTMMYPRMALCHDMLKEGGVLMVHIDKNEFHHLRCILDEIYGAKNHMIDFVWKKKVGGGNDNVAGYTVHEYIVCYAKNRTKAPCFRIPLEEHQMGSYGNWDNDPRGDYKPESIQLRRGGCQLEVERYKNRFYTITHPVDFRSIDAVWAIPEGKFEELWADNRIVWGKGRSSPCQKIFRTDREKEGISPNSLIDTHATLTVRGRKDLEALDMASEEYFGHRVLYFDFPKPVALIKHLLRIFGKDITVMDIFAGSCSTAHAIIDQNAEDDGTRNWIMIQRPDELDENAVARDVGCKTLCDIGQMRIERVFKQLIDSPSLFNKQNMGYHILKLEETDEV